MELPSSYNAFGQNCQEAKMIPQSYFFPSFRQSCQRNRQERYNWLMLATRLMPGALMMLAWATTPAQSAQNVRILEPDKAVERELMGGESHAYQVALSAGQYLEVTVA